MDYLNFRVGCCLPNTDKMSLVTPEALKDKKSTARLQKRIQNAAVPLLGHTLEFKESETTSESLSVLLFAVYAVLLIQNV